MDLCVSQSTMHRSDGPWPPSVLAWRSWFDGGTYQATVIVDEGRRGEVCLLVEGKTFVLRGGVADGLRGLGVDWL